MKTLQQMKLAEAVSIKIEAVIQEWLSAQRKHDIIFSKDIRDNAEGVALAIMEMIDTKSFDKCMSCGSTNIGAGDDADTCLDCRSGNVERITV